MDAERFLAIRKPRLSGQIGFSLVEVMIAVVIFAIFILAVGTILTSAWKFWNNGWQQVRVQRDASYAFEIIEKVVREGSTASVIDGGSGLQVVKNGSSGWTKTFQSVGGVLQLDDGSGPDNVISGVQSISFSTAGNAVSVSLSLLNGSASANFRTTILLRNP